MKMISTSLNYADEMNPRGHSMVDSQQLLKTTKRAGLLAGIVHLSCAHGTRRGATTDIVNITKYRKEGIAVAVSL